LLAGLEMLGAQEWAIGGREPFNHEVFEDEFSEKEANREFPDMHGPLDAPRPLAGAIVLVVTFGMVAAKLEPAGLEPLEILHYGMAAALLLICL